MATVATPPPANIGSLLRRLAAGAATGAAANGGATEGSGTGCTGIPTIVSSPAGASASSGALRSAWAKSAAEA
jgi:hypothetical protein